MSPTVLSSGVLHRWQARLHAWRQGLMAAWGRRTRREQVLLLVAGALLCCAGVWLLGVRPALTIIAQAQQQLPGLQARAAQLDTVILEAKALGRERQGVLSVPETTQALEASLVGSDFGVAAHLIVLDAAGGDVARWQLDVQDAAAGPLLRWVADLPVVARLRIVSMDLARSVVDGRDRPGRLSGQLILALPQTGGAS